MTISPFAYEALPARVIFGRGTIAATASEIERLGRQRALILTTPQQADMGVDLVARLGGLCVGHYAGATMHTPKSATDDALAVLRDKEADCVVSLGGGSTTGLGKALALRTGADQVCIPTTYAGSEMTPILGQTADGRKTTVTTRDVLPETVIYDINLTLGLPPALSATSGINAMAHAVEALYARDRNPIIALMAEEAIRALAGALPAIVMAPDDVNARTAALYGAWLCGSCLGAVGMALHHKLCHTLGGMFDLPHAETHAIILPYAVAYNAPAVPDSIATIARALGTPDAVQGLFDLTRRLGVPRTLKSLGMPLDGIERAANAAMENPYWNPRLLQRDSITNLIAKAYAGDAPGAAP